MENFNYHRPTKPADAVKAMKKAKDGKFLSGGMTLLPTMKQGLASPTDIIDLGGLKNSGITAAAAKVVVKAGTVHADVASDKGVKKAIPALAVLILAPSSLPAVRCFGQTGLLFCATSLA